MHLINSAAIGPEQSPLTWLIVCGTLAALGLGFLGTKSFVMKTLGLISLFCGVSGLLNIFDVFSQPSIAWFILSLLMTLVSLPELGRNWGSNKTATIIFAFSSFIGVVGVYLTLNSIVELPTGTVGEVIDQGLERFKTLFDMVDDQLKQWL